MNQLCQQSNRESRPSSPLTDAVEAPRLPNEKDPQQSAMALLEVALKRRLSKLRKPGPEPIFSPEDSDLRKQRWYWMTGYASGYCRPSFKTRWTFVSHRLVLERKLGRALATGEICDHINGNRIDNRRENLRIVNRLQNAQHQPSGNPFRGALMHGKRWRASVNSGGKRYSSGCYDSVYEAAFAAKMLREFLGFADEEVKL